MCKNCHNEEQAVRRLAAVPGATNERPLKRRRAVSDPSRETYLLSPAIRFGAPAKLERDPEFWFEDGSIVLIAYGDIGFRVYKRILAEHSAFFRDLFSIPQPPKVPKIDGCPYVYVSDFPSQLRHLLRALFPTKGHLAFGKPPDGLSMDAVCSVVGLAHKYQIEQLVTQGLTHLTEYYTDDFKQWCESSRSTSLEPKPIEALRAINIAHLTGTTSILPLAFLHASRAGSRVLLGCVREDGSREGVAIEDVQRILDGRVELIRSASTALARIFKPEVSEICTDSRRCLKVLAQKASRLDTVLEKLYDEGFATSWVHLVNLKGESGNPPTPWGLCQDCLEMVEERDLWERRSFWNDLPDVFRLKVDGWEA
ncbi:hypothetical protein OH76DRAFT_1404202 [Lentinus brumalis]|uniref:BTB domain-containing protein n=1 Tax=Lentinus brumalis TaxID=2498619 RepID=A0A371D8Y3_9APHY|nr:hypothetical protein OH76DRAFT_1404202 [Polyporus brumalis]